jgi:hypothetical protein
VKATLVPVSEPSLAAKADLGGKVRNCHRMAQSLPINSNFLLRLPRSAVLPDIQPDTSGALPLVTEEVLAGAGLAAFPLIVRSSAAHEDMGDSRFSGIFESFVVNSVTEMNGAVARLYLEASRNSALPISALVQPEIQFKRGLLLGISGDTTGPIAARGEYAYSSVPVEAAPTGSIVFLARRAAGLTRWKPVHEADVLCDTFDVEGAFLELLGFVSSLDWPELRENKWFAEIEAGFTGEDIWIFQIRFDTTTPLNISPGEAKKIPFGTGRNFPAPVSRMTSGIIAPVLTKQFGAPIALDEVEQRLVCASTMVPPASFVSSCVRAVRAEGFLTITAVSDNADWLNGRWSEVVKSRSLVGSLSGIEAFEFAVREFQRHLAWYFSNSMFRRAVGTEYLLENIAEASVNYNEIDFLPNRAALATKAFGLRSPALIERAGSELTCIYLFGDDSVGTPRLVEKLFKDPADAEFLESLISKFFSREQLFRRDESQHAIDRISEMRLSPQQAQMLASLWYQEQDNQYKDALYYMLREALQGLSGKIEMPLSEILELYPSELSEVARDLDVLPEYRLRSQLRIRMPESFRISSIETVGDVPQMELRATIDPSAENQVRQLEVVHVPSLSVIRLDSEETRQGRVYATGTASPMDCLDVPAVGGLWLYGLGELSHAAHVLRSRGVFPILVFGQLKAAMESTGMLRMTCLRGSVAMEPLVR